MATHLIGNSIEQFSLIIALMLFAMGIAGFIQEANERYDVIIADFPDPRSPDLARLFSMELYQQLQVSTRLDPRVMRLYLAGEPIDAPRLFVGAAYR